MHNKNDNQREKLSSRLGSLLVGGMRYRTWQYMAISLYNGKIWRRRFRYNLFNIFTYIRTSNINNGV